MAGKAKTPKEIARQRVLVRANLSGVWAGELESRNGAEMVLRNARRCWRWYGAASCSELATRGTSRPKECKFPAPVDRVELIGVFEIINMTDTAWESVMGVPVWSA